MRWLPGKRRERGMIERRPFHSLQREMNRLFDDFFDDFSPALFETADEKFGSFVPRVDMSENEKEIQVSAELPGMDEKDVEVTLSNGTLAIKGEKKIENRKEDGGNYYLERSSGSFYREISLPDGIDCDKAEAVFKKGVLEVKVPKTGEKSKEVKKIPIK